MKNPIPKSFFPESNLNPFISFLFEKPQLTSSSFQIPPYSQLLQLTHQQKQLKNNVINWLKKLNQKQRIWVLLLDNQQLINRICKVISCYGQNIYFTIGPAQLYHPITSLKRAVNHDFLEMIHICYGFNPKIIINKNVDLQEIINIMDQVSGGRLFCNWMSQVGFATVDQWIVYFMQQRTIKHFERWTDDMNYQCSNFFQQMTILLQLIQSTPQIRQRYLKLIDPKVIEKIPCVIRFPLKFMSESVYVGVRELVRQVLCQYKEKQVRKSGVKRNNSTKKKKVKDKINQKKKQVRLKFKKITFKQPEIQFYLQSQKKQFIHQPSFTSTQSNVISNPYQLQILQNNSTSDSIADNEEIKKQLQHSNYLGKKLIQKILKLKLNNDFLDLSNKMSMNYNSTIKDRRVIVQRLKKVITSINNNFEIKLFGSNATGISLYQSDIDILIQCNLKMNCQKQIIINMFSWIQKKLQIFKWVIEIKKILTAQIPILKLIVDPKIDIRQTYDSQFYRPNFDTHSNNKHLFKVDISIQTGQQLGLISTYFIKEWIKQNQLNSVIVILKYILKKRHLNQNYTGILYQIGGLSSYGLVLLVAAYVKSAQAKEKQHFQIFMNFLNFYGNKFNPKKTGIDLQKQPNQIFYQVEQKDDIYLHLIDPISKREILMYTYRIWDILAMFSEIYQMVQKIYRQSKDILVSHTKSDVGIRDGMPFEQKFRIACNNMSQNVIKKCIFII